jgi:hypothetical protein
MGKQARNAHRDAERAAVTRPPFAPNVVADGFATGSVRELRCSPWPLLSRSCSSKAMARGSALNGLQVFAEPNYRHVTTSVTYNRTRRLAATTARRGRIVASTTSPSRTRTPSTRWSTGQFGSPIGRICPQIRWPSFSSWPGRVSTLAAPRGTSC